MGRKEGAPKGYVPMLVGRGSKREKVLVHTDMFKHPCFALLLEMAAQEFGFRQEGVLKIPCSVDQFRSAISAAAQTMKVKS